MARKKPRNTYKDDSLPDSTKGEQVFMWRKRIENAQKKLCLARRAENAEEADLYLTGAKKVPTSGRNRAKIYMNYLLPLFEELHRGSIPEIPEPEVEGTTEAAALQERGVRQFINLMFSRHGDEIEREIKSGQWDDDKYGVMVYKAEWLQKSIDAAPAVGMSQENSDVNAARAAAENRDPSSAIISADDLDIVHIGEHQGAVESLDPASDDYRLLSSHLSQHQWRLKTVTKEGVRFRRVRPDWYVYDPECRWSDRGWEAECKSVRVKNLKANGYKNVTEDNAPAQHSDELVPYEDKMILIWEIHDRLNGRELVIPVDGPKKSGRFLKEADWRYGGLDIYHLDTFHNINPDESWGEPTTHVTMAIAERLAVVDYNIERHVTNHPCAKVFVPDGAGASRIKKAIRDPDQVVIPIPVELAGSVKIYDPPKIPDSLLLRKADLENGLRRAVGLDAQDIGASNPHAVTATESYARSTASSGRMGDRQKIITKILTWIGGMFLKLYRDMAVNGVQVKSYGPEGPVWEMIQPRDLPVDIDIAFDIAAITDKDRAENITIADRVLQANMASQVPVDQGRLLTWYNRKLGVKRPGQFIARGAPSPENSIQTQGSPGVSGSSVTPTGTQQNQEANARFGGGAEALSQTS